MFNKYREIGLSIIPIIAGQKRPIEANWSQYCDRLPTEEEVERWESEGHTSFGLCLGGVSGLLGIDIDSDDPKILDAVKPSPVRKRGKKGETRFFRAGNDVPSCKVAGIIDVLAHGRQTIMPRSPHPDGVFYEWTTPDTLENFQVSDLPLFTLDDLNDLRSALEPDRAEANEAAGSDLKGGPWRNEDPTRLSPTGSQDRLKRIANAMISRGASPDEAVRELIRFDEENHLPVGYFRDKTRSDFFADPISNALFFYASNVKTFNRREMKATGKPVIPLVSGSELMEITGVTSVAPDAWKPLALPEPSGLVKEIRDLILRSSKYQQPGLASAGALAICSVLIANRYRMDETWPNLNCLAISPTGTGKQAVVTACQRLLQLDVDTQLYGKEEVVSSQAYIEGLAVTPQRLDVVDECAHFFQMITEGGIWQSSILKMLLKLYSNSNGMYMVPQTAQVKATTILHPCVSSLFLTNADDFKLSVNRTFITGGFLPRTIAFIEEGRGPRNPDFGWDEALAAKVIQQIETLMSLDILMDDPEGTMKGKKKNLLARRPSPRCVKITDGARQVFRLLDQELDEETAGDKISELRRHMVSRMLQNAEKVALIHGILTRGFVDVQDAQYGVDLVRASIHNSEPLYTRIMSSSPAEEATIQVIDVVRKAGTLSEAALYTATRRMTRTQRNDAIDAACVEGKIRKVVEAGRRVNYQFLG